MNTFTFVVTDPCNLTQQQKKEIGLDYVNCYYDGRDATECLYYAIRKVSFNCTQSISWTIESSCYVYYTT